MNFSLVWTTAAEWTGNAPCSSASGVLYVALRRIRVTHIAVPTRRIVEYARVRRMEGPMCGAMFGATASNRSNQPIDEKCISMFLRFHVDVVCKAFGQTGTTRAMAV